MDLEALSNRQINQYYDVLARGNKSRIARILDYIALRAVLVLSVYIWFL